MADLSDDADDADDDAPPAAQSSEAGTAALLPASDAVVFSIAPTAASRFNTLRPALRPSACWRIDDARFAFASSFIRPDAAREFALLAALRPPDASGDAALRLSVFGHADPTGKDDDNKVLAGRRATAVYGLLVRDTALWEELYSSPFNNDKWGIASVQVMLRALGQDGASNSGVLDRATENALKQYQVDSGLPASGAPDGATRKQLFSDYMDLICSDGTDPFQYAPADFVSQGASSDGKADRQGCGEFNPVLVFSEEQAKEYQDSQKKAARDADNLSNRRVVVYMFSPTLPIDVGSWPCPTVKEGVGGCKAQFFGDGDDRRNPQEKQRQYLRNGRTFACKFYDRLARGAPCEGVRQNIVLFLLGEDGSASKNAPYRLSSGAEVREGLSDGDGRVFEQQVMAGVSCEIEWGKSDDDGSDPVLPNFAEVFLNTGPDDDDGRLPQRQLYNLGYRNNSNRLNRKDFGVEYDDSDTSDDAVKVAHESGTPKQTRVEPA